MIQYKEIKDIPKKQLFILFDSVGWVKSPQEKLSKNKVKDSIANHTLYIQKNGNLIKKAFQNSTYVVSAWDNKKLVGVVRVLSDQIQRSIIYCRGI
ncbi:MAG: hypothetical protein ABIC82_01785 [bacterium]